VRVKLETLEERPESVALFVPHKSDPTKNKLAIEVPGA
jgi:hypothetical protein